MKQYDIMLETPDSLFSLTCVRMKRTQKAQQATSCEEESRFSLADAHNNFVSHSCGFSVNE